jgi:hypothetical protein
VGVGLAAIVAALYFSAIELARLRHEVDQTYSSLEAAGLKKTEVEAATAKAQEKERDIKGKVAELQTTLDRLQTKLAEEQTSSTTDKQDLHAAITKAQTIANQIQTAENKLPGPTINADSFHEQEYTGRAGNLTFTTTLKWHQSGLVEGSYVYADGRTYALQGVNYNDRRLRLTEFKGNTKTATVELSKSQTSDNVVWSGTMHNTDGRQFPFRIERPLTKQ